MPDESPRSASEPATPASPGSAGDARPSPPGDAALDEMELESFPASDAPSTWAGESAADRPAGREPG